MFLVIGYEPVKPTWLGITFLWVAYLPTVPERPGDSRIMGSPPGPPDEMGSLQGAVH